VRTHSADHAHKALAPFLSHSGTGRTSGADGSNPAPSKDGQSLHTVLLDQKKLQSLYGLSLDAALEDRSYRGDNADAPLPEINTNALRSLTMLYTYGTGDSTCAKRSPTRSVAGSISGLRPIGWDFWTFIPKGDMPRWTCVILEVLDRMGRICRLGACRGGLILTATSGV
jgi:hypothetical protein